MARLNSQSVNVESAASRPDPSYKKVLERIQADAVCPFCPDHLAKYHTKPMLYEGDSWRLTENMHPYAGSSVHLLAIHRTHVEHINELTPASWEELRAIIGGEVGRVAIEGATMLMRFGDTRFNGASVSHLHAQLIAGTGEEGSQPVITRVG